MPRGRTIKAAPTLSKATVLLVGPPSPSLRRKRSLLEDSGFEITLAENICYAEVFAEERQFDAAVYDESVPTQEQISLALIMRMRWPWMRLVACGTAASPNDEKNLFDANESLETRLPGTSAKFLLPPSTKGTGQDVRC